MLSLVALPANGGIVTLGLFPVAPAPISAVGLTAGHPFEGWIRLAISPDPSVDGRSLAAGSTIAITFPPAFAPTNDVAQAYLLRGWPQGDIATPFSVGRSDDPHTIIIRLGGAITSGGNDGPGLKAIHLIAPFRNPGAGRYPIHVSITQDAEVESGDTPVTINARAAPSIAAFNGAHDGADADWQRVAPGARAPVPFDFIVNDVHGGHPDGLALAHSPLPYALEIRRGGRVIGHLTAAGGARIEPAPAPFTQTVRATVYAPLRPGVGIVKASLENGTGTTLRIFAQ